MLNKRLDHMLIKKKHQYADIGRAFLFLLFLFSCSCYQAFAQTTNYGQFWNEFAFTRTLSRNWSMQLDLGQRYTSTPEDHRLASRNSQLYGRLWAHYFPSPKWKLSAAYSYHFNRYVPEINQRESPELRFAVQATYYIRRVFYTLNLRMRVEDRHVYNADGVYEGYYRFRGQLRYLQPLNAKRVRKGVVYSTNSAELMVKTNSKVGGSEFFDRTRVTLGIGYAFTDDLQVDLSYLNEWLPRKSGDKITNALQLNISINNFLRNIHKKLFHNP